jgi:D-arginine dehydrogenase
VDSDVLVVGAGIAGAAAGDHTAPLLVDAAGAWADGLAVLAGTAPLGLVPHRCDRDSTTRT